MDQIEIITNFCKTRRSEIGKEQFENMRAHFLSFLDNLEAASKERLQLQNKWCRDKMDDTKYSDPCVAPCNKEMILLWDSVSRDYNVPFESYCAIPSDDFSHAVLVTDTDERLDVPNLLHHIKVSSQMIESCVRELQYDKDKRKCKLAEGKLKIAFIPSFYRFLLREKRIPNQEEFFNEYYIDCLLAGFDFDRKPERYKIGLKNRICSRTYPSIIRDIHFCKVLSEILPEKGYDVLYNSEIDIKGIDVLIRERRTGKLIGVCLFIKTKNSIDQIEGHKACKRNYFKKVNFIELPIPCDSTSEGIWLYDKDSVEELLKILDNKD